MWILLGPFDGETTGDVDFTKTKLVKPGCSYMLGRKDKALVVNHKKVSREHVVFQVGEYTTEDVEDPERKPKLTVKNLGSANRQCKRDEHSVTIDRTGAMDLQDGDVIEIVHGIFITVKWEKVVCYCSPGQDKARANIQECAKLGVSVVWKPHAEVTHHLTSIYSLTAAIATSLVARAHLVKPEWLDALLSLGLSSVEPSTLEYEFALPSVAKFRPSFSPSLPSSLKNHRSWEPNQNRENMLVDYRIIFVGERGREAKEEYKELARQGGAAYECCPAQGGKKALHDVLAKAESKGKQPVLIADEITLLAALGQEGWNELTEEAAAYELRFIPTEKLIQTVLHVDRSYIDCSLSKSAAASNQSIPDVILNTDPDEPSVPPDAMDVEPSPVLESRSSGRKLVRRTGGRATSRASSPLPRIDSQTQQETGLSSASSPTGDCTEREHKKEEPARKLLVRRFKGQVRTPVVGISDASMDEGSANSSRAEASQVEDLQLAPVSTQARTLKRRFGSSAQPRSQAPTIFDIPVIPEEPPHKKHKSLFDDLDPDKVAQSDMNEYINMFKTSSQHQDNVESNKSTGSGPRVLEAVAEGGEEGTQTQSRNSALHLMHSKRKAGDSDDAEIADAGTSRNAKRRAMEIDAVEPSQATTSASDAPPPSKTSSKTMTNSKLFDNRQASSEVVPDEPDKDEAFLKAVASTKRGKKHEDIFDKEFNNLRISKPDLQQIETRNEWAVLDDFGDDSNIRGNFMVVMELDVYKKGDVGRDAVRVGSGRIDWEGRPNFKKFKQKAVGDRRKPVELVVDEDSYMIESDIVYKDGHTQSTYDSDDELVLPKLSGKTGKQVSRASSEEPRAARQSKAKAKTLESRTHSRRHTNSSKAAPKKAQPLFIDSDEEDEGVNERLSAVHEDEEGDINNSDLDMEDSTLATIRSQDTRRGTQKRPAALMNDDSDDEFKISPVNKRTRR